MISRFGEGGRGSGYEVIEVDDTDRRVYSQNEKADEVQELYECNGLCWFS
jgi:hypothetical protein